MSELKEHCHFIGVGGIGMSGLARILSKKKYLVTGSDIAQNATTHQLQREGIAVTIGHSEKNIPAGATIIYSSGIAKDNAEYQAAIEKKCHLLHRSDLLKLLMHGQENLAVAGSHGKTTTSSLLTTVLVAANLSPSFAIGGIVRQLETNADHGVGRYFIAEADESDGTFLKYHSHGAIVTNIGSDHLNYFGSMENLTEAFRIFMNHVENKNLLFWCGDDERLRSIAVGGNSYGFSAHNSWRLSAYTQTGWSSSFVLSHKGHAYEPIESALIGKHNALNAAAVFGLALSLGISEKVIRHALQSFSGVHRRCEKKGEEQSILFLDDYAHHPNEIKATLAGVRNAIEARRLVVVFQPHRYSRMKDCLGQFHQVFSEADHLLITDIYSAGESPIDGVTHQEILAEVQQTFKGKIWYAPRGHLVEHLYELLRPYDVVMTLGAGDITHLGLDLIGHLKQNPVKKWSLGLIYGGRSAEHEVSLTSARNVHQHLNKAYYDISYFAITKEGKWLSGEEAEKQLYNREVVGNSDALPQLDKCDILFSVLHGPFGEDGTIQGFFEILDKPYVGCGHRAAAVAMDKALTKRIAMLNGVAVASFYDFTQHQWKSHPEHHIELIKQRLKLPVFLKPIHLGSSIGVKKVTSWDQLPDAIDYAFTFDNRLIVENGIRGRELEFAVYGNDYLHAYPPGEVLTQGKVFDYESKYGEHSFETTARAELPQNLIEEGMLLAQEVYRAMECAGMARIDFFLDEEGRLLLNEVNPIPGFTEKSLYHLICSENGLALAQLLDLLVVLGFQRTRSQQNYAVVP